MCINSQPKCFPSNDANNRALDQSAKNNAQALRALLQNAILQKVINSIGCQNDLPDSVLTILNKFQLIKTWKII